MRRNKVFVIAEAGSNWRAGTRSEDCRRARSLIDVAATAGADAVKFQTYRAESVYAPNAGKSAYLARHGMRESISDIFKRLEMPYDMIPELASYCHRKKIQFMSSVFSKADFQAVNPFVRIHKIASYEISHPELLNLVARSKKPLILSTGAATIMDIDWAVRFFKKMGGRGLVLMQCTAKYPAPLRSLNLLAIPALRRRYGLPCGLSDHSQDPFLAAIAAVALGATAIEKHFTLDRSLPGPDHPFALIPAELKRLVEAVRGCEEVLGDGRKVVQPEERELRRFAQRAVQAIRPIRKGEVFKKWLNIGILRPGKRKTGAHPKFLRLIEGKKAARAIAAGDGVRVSDGRPR